MKKQILPFAILSVFLLMFSCEKNVLVDNSNLLHYDLLHQFTSSDDFNTLFNQNIYFKDIGNVDYNKSKVETISVDNDNHNILSVAISKDDIITGQIIGIKLPKESKKLTTGHTYIMAFRDYREFSFETKSGIIRDYDLNYDGYNCGYILVEDNLIQSIDASKMPYHIQKKYSFKKGSNYNSKHPCDFSGDGDISFGECYGCLREAINSHGDTEFLCDALNILGVCNLSVAVSCIIISSRE